MNDLIGTIIVFTIVFFIIRTIVKSCRIADLHRSMSNGYTSEVKSWIILYGKYLSKTEKTDIYLWIAKQDHLI